MGMSWTDYLKLRIKDRGWLVARIDREINKAAEAQSDIPSKAPHHNPPELRNMLGKVKSLGSQNAKIQRFT